MSWILIASAPEEELEIVSALLFDEGALGVEVQDGEVMLMPGTPKLPAGRGRCIAHFEDRDTATGAALELRIALPAVEVHDPIELEESDWRIAWRTHHHPMRVGPRSWVYPPWEVPPLGPGEVGVAIDPGMAFGTGKHPTTALCLERVDELLAERPGADLLDVGTGSGVIAILAARLSAGRICGTENDPVALEVAREGAALNGLPPERISWQLRDCDALTPPDDAPYSIVVVNILLNTVVDLAPQIARKVAPGGTLLLSGLLEPQGDEAEEAYLAQGLQRSARAEREGWLRVELTRPR